MRLLKHTVIIAAIVLGAIGLTGCHGGDHPLWDWGHGNGDHHDLNH